MGQNVNYLLGNQSQLMGADPELYRQQLIQQEQARIQAMPAQNQLGAQLGNLLGRGISNVANDRGFFEVTNPVLQKLQKIQGVYDSAMQSSDPNDPLSFYTTLQKQFAEAGLGQQALMAAEQSQKFEQTKLTGEKLKTEVYKNNPSLLDAQIEKARTAGNDTLANQLADQRGKLQVQIDTDRAMDVAKLGLVNAQTAAQRAQAGKLSQEMETGKYDWKVINDITGAPTHMAKINKRTGETSYEPIALPGAAPTPGAPAAPAKGEKPDPSSFDKRVTTTPAATPGTPSSPAAPTAWNDTTKTYTLAQDPTIQEIKNVAAQNADRLATDEKFREAINRAQNDRIAQIKQQYGNMINIQY